MKKHFFGILLFTVSAVFAQPAIQAPALGTVRDSSGALHAIIGVSGNFIVTGTSLPNAVSAAFSAAAGLVKTDTEVLALDQAAQIANRYATPAGPALFAFDSAGAPALAYYSGMLFHFDNNQLMPVNWTGDAVSIALAATGSAAAIVRRDGGLWNTRITIATGAVESESLLVDVNEPSLLLASGSIAFIRDSNIVVRDSSGVERLIPAGFNVDSFEQMGREWITVREAQGARLFALHVRPDTLELFQLPEVSQ